jgi:hypothetical protein
MSSDKKVLFLMHFFRETAAKRNHCYFISYKCINTLKFCVAVIEIL